MTLLSFFNEKLANYVAVYEPIRSRETRNAEVDGQSCNLLPREPREQNV